jgi:hypothetical protein
MEFLATAAPEQLLLCMVAPIVGAIFFGGVLFVSFRSRLNKKQSKSITPQPAPLNFRETALPLPDESLPQPDAQVIQPMPPPAASVNFDLNFDLLNRPDGNTPTLDYQPELSLASDMEATMMNLPNQPHGKRGLSARIGNRALAAASSPQPQTPEINPALPVSGLPAGAATALVSQAPAVSPTSAPVELLRLLRDPQTGQLIVEIAGRRYTKLADIADKEMGQYILKLAAQLLAFTNGMIATEAGVKSFQVPKLGAAPLPPLTLVSAAEQPRPQAAEVGPALTPKNAPQVEAAFLASLVQPPTPPEPQPQRRGFFGRPKPAQVEEPLLPPLNLAEQINKIAQAKLMASPLAYTTRLEITSDLHGGIRINVNGTPYPSPDDVPNPEVRELIKDSIRVWEKS